MILMVPAICFAVSGYPQKTVSKNLTLTTANSTYNFDFPTGTGGIVLQSRTAADFKISSISTFTTDFFTIKSGTVYSTGTLGLGYVSPNTNIYFQSTTAGQVVEILYYQ